MQTVFLYLPTNVKKHYEVKMNDYLKIKKNKTKQKHASSYCQASNLKAEKANYVLKTTDLKHY